MVPFAPWRITALFIQYSPFIRFYATGMKLAIIINEALPQGLKSNTAAVLGI